MLKLPQLIYVHKIWSDEEKHDWFKTSRNERLALLNARGNAINSKVSLLPGISSRQSLTIFKQLVMPIALLYEHDDYDNIKIISSLSTTVMTYNASGWLHLGSHSDIVAGASGFPGSRGPLTPGY